MPDQIKTMPLRETFHTTARKGSTDIEKGLQSRRHSDFSEKAHSGSITETEAVLNSGTNKVGPGDLCEETPAPAKKTPRPKKHWRPSKIWFFVVFIGLGTCWIPAILAWTNFPGARIWGVKLLFWSIWLSIFWADRKSVV